MDNKEFAKELENRTREFAVRIIRLSRTFFRNKIKICESEASETRYWLEAIVKIKWLTWAKVKWEYEECGELLGIFTSAANK